MRSSRRMRLTSDDFPTFGRPTMAIRGSGSSAFCSSVFLSGSRSMTSSSRSPIALPVLCRNLHHRLEPELVEIERARLRAFVVSLVDGDDHRPALHANGLCDLVVSRHQPFAPIDDEHEHGGVLERRASRARAPASVAGLRFDRTYRRYLSAETEHCAS